jgi:hypothetical protein
MTTQLQIGQMALAEIGTRSTVTSTGTTANGTVFNDASEEALYLDMYYGPVRDHALRAARWGFAHQSDVTALWKSVPGTAENPLWEPGWQRTMPARPWLYSYVITYFDFIYARSVIAQPEMEALNTPPIFTSNSSGPTLPHAIRVPFEISMDPYGLDGLVLPQDQVKKVILTNAKSPLFEFTSGYHTEVLWDATFVMVVVLALAGRLAIALTGDKQMAQIKMDAANQLIIHARVNDANESLTVIDHIPDWLSIRGVGTSTPAAYDFYYPYGPLFTVAPFM